MTTPEQEAVLTLCLLAAFADGGQSERERAELKRIAASLPDGTVHPAPLYQRVLLRQVTPAAAAAALQTPELRQLAYEVAVCVCEADDVLNAAERAFLGDLRRELRLEAPLAANIEQSAESLATTPLAQAEVAPPGAAGAPAGAAPELDALILRYAILAGALELMPESLATLAIIPLQMKLVYTLGRRHGFTLDRGHIKELLAAAGLGLTSQVVEGYARKLIGGLLGQAGAGWLKGPGRQAAGSAMSFASTYALGHLARRYYAGGRSLSAVQLRELFGSFTEQARALHGRYAGQIEQQATQVRLPQLVPLLKSV